MSGAAANMWQNNLRPLSPPQSPAGNGGKARHHKKGSAKAATPRGRRKAARYREERERYREERDQSQEEASAIKGALMGVRAEMDAVTKQSRVEREGLLSEVNYLREQLELLENDARAYRMLTDEHTRLETNFGQLLDESRSWQAHADALRQRLKDTEHRNEQRVRDTEHLKEENSRLELLLTDARQRLQEADDVEVARQRLLSDAVAENARLRQINSRLSDEAMQHTEKLQAAAAATNTAKAEVELVLVEVASAERRTAESVALAKSKAEIAAAHTDAELRAQVDELRAENEKLRQRWVDFGEDGHGGGAAGGGAAASERANKTHELGLKLGGLERAVELLREEHAREVVELRRAGERELSALRGSTDRELADLRDSNARSTAEMRSTCARELAEGRQAAHRELTESQRACEASLAEARHLGAEQEARWAASLQEAKRSAESELLEQKRRTSEQETRASMAEHQLKMHAHQLQVAEKRVEEVHMQADLGLRAAQREVAEHRSATEADSVARLASVEEQANVQLARIKANAEEQVAAAWRSAEAQAASSTSWMMAGRSPSMAVRPTPSTGVGGGMLSGRGEASSSSVDGGTVQLSMPPPGRPISSTNGNGNGGDAAAGIGGSRGGHGEAGIQLLGTTSRIQPTSSAASAAAAQQSPTLQMYATNLSRMDSAWRQSKAELDASMKHLDASSSELTRLDLLPGPPQSHSGARSLVQHGGGGGGLHRA